MEYFPYLCWNNVLFLEQNTNNTLHARLVTPPRNSVRRSFKWKKGLDIQDTFKSDAK